MKPITDQTLDEYALNPDGKTYNGVKVVQWLLEVTTGKSVPEAEARELVRKAQEKATFDHSIAARIYKGRKEEDAARANRSVEF